MTFDFLIIFELSKSRYCYQNIDLNAFGLPNCRKKVILLPIEISRWHLDCPTVECNWIVTNRNTWIIFGLPNCWKPIKKSNNIMIYILNC